MSRRSIYIAALAALVVVPAGASASRPAELRAVNSNGKVLAQHSQYTGKTGIRTSKDADCFGGGTGGSGKKVRVRGATPLGLLDHAGRWDNRSRYAGVSPLGVTDFFDFGLGLCRIGGSKASRGDYWYLKVNHVGAESGGDQVRLKSNDEVLWYLVDDAADPTPPELVVDLPARVRSEDARKTKVQVWEYSDNGSRKPARGALVSFASKPTGKDGKTTLDEIDPSNTSGGRFTVIGVQAVRFQAIPAGFERMCISDKLSVCQSQPPSSIFGSPRKDVVRGTRGNDTIYPGKGDDVVRAKRGDDVIDVRGGGRDIVRCGSGDDSVKADKRDKLRGCK